MSKFLLIENPGVAALESFTLLGASNKAGTEAIGQFGSGTKFGALALLRKGVKPIVTVGTLRIEYGLEDIAFQGAEHKQVVVSLKGKTEEGKQVNRTEKLSVVLNYGATDWGNLSLAVREFVSNALDATNGDASQVRVEIVDNVRAASGKTRVFIPLSEQWGTEASHEDAEILEVYYNLKSWFLHFDEGKVWRQSSIIEKSRITPARIYRRGVFVRSITEGEKESLFDYNLNDLSLDEARVANDWNVKWEAAKFIRAKAIGNQLAELIQCQRRVWESDFDLVGTYDHLSPAQEQIRTERWQEAQELTLGEAEVFQHPESNADLAKGKGYTAVIVPPAVYEACVRYGLKTPVKLLTKDEREGRRVDAETNPLAVSAFETVWSKLEGIGVTRGEAKPTFHSFSQEIAAGVILRGFQRDGGVYVNNNLLAEGGLSQELFSTCLEEIAHYITKATDCSRDFQEFFIVALTKILLAS